MKRLVSILLVLLFFISFPMTVHADPGDGNIDGGGGGMHDGSGTNFWNPGDEGVRVTVVRTSDHAIVTTPVDFSNKIPTVIVHFGKVSKILYISGKRLTPDTGSYQVINPVQVIPKIISSASGTANIDAIKRYFCSEYAVKMIANEVGMNYDVLINGDYKLLLEPVGYFTLQGIKLAATATEVALYDEQLGGGVRSRLVSFSHKNLPLSMFLEVSDLGFPAWSGSRSSPASNADIKSALGLGVVRFKDNLEPPVVSTYDYEYRVNTEVITAVTVSGGQSDPDHPVSVSFNITGTTYTVGNVFYPSGDSQLAWVRWTTPPTPQVVSIPVTVNGGGSASDGLITISIVDLSGNDPPNPVADDRNDSFTGAAVPSKPQATTGSWGVWRPIWHANWVWHSAWVWVSDGTGGGGWVDFGNWVDEGWWDFNYDHYSASLSATMNVVPDAKAPTASGNTLKSGYGVNQTVAANISTNQSSAVTDAQTAVTYFPEWRYETYWRQLERTQSGYSSKFEFKSNKYSTYKSRTHFTPIWFPDGSYTPYTWLIDCWTPAGMLSMNLTDSVTIRGSLWDDWHIAPAKP
jgi:hypothetical protein